MAFRFDFAPEVVAERSLVLQRIRDLLTQDTRETVQEAGELQRAWLDRYPDDAIMWETGEVLAMTEDALQRIMPLTEPVPAR